MTSKIAIRNLQKRITISPTKITKTTKKILKSQGVVKAVLSFVFVTDSQIKKINKKYLNHDFATDVITFDLSDNPCQRGRKGLIEIDGEIIISAATAARNAKEHGMVVEQEINLYIAHGILHLLGYDDHKLEDKKKMRKKEVEILANIK